MQLPVNSIDSRNDAITNKEWRFPSSSRVLGRPRRSGSFGSLSMVGWEVTTSNCLNSVMSTQYQYRANFYAHDWALLNKGDRNFQVTRNPSASTVRPQDQSQRVYMYESDVVFEWKPCSRAHVSSKRGRQEESLLYQSEVRRIYCGAAPELPAEGAREGPKGCSLPTCGSSC